MLFGTQQNINNQLHIGGLSASDLVKEYGSPLYVYDVAHIKSIMNEYKTYFKSNRFNTRIAYASKAFLTKAMVQLVEEQGLSMDVVSGGELYTAVQAKFNTSNILFHGNNKSPYELEMAIDQGVGLIVVDNISELELLIDIATKKQQHVQTLLRVNPGVEAHTHEYVVTAKLTSKFGESIYDDERIKEIAALYHNQDFVSLEGFHCHIGSQIFDIASYQKTVEVMAEFFTSVKETYDLNPHIFNIGGGFGVYYTDGDDPITIKDISTSLIETVEFYVKRGLLQIDELIIEPGRSIVANAGTTLYTIGYTKETYGKKNYLFVDGGMTDNIRPALYQAEYSASIATNMNGAHDTTYTVAGKLCESGDVLIQNIQLPEAQPQDILAIYTTGAYTYSMASNYNRLLKPAVVFVENHNAHLVVKRETFDDLIRNDI